MAQACGKSVPWKYCTKHPDAEGDDYGNCEACMNEEDKAYDEAQKQMDGLEPEAHSPRCSRCGRFKSIGALCACKKGE